MDEASLESSAARAYRDGRIDSKLEQHEERLNQMNTAMDRIAANTGLLATAVEALRHDLHASNEAVRVAAELLATETTAKAEALAAITAGTVARWAGWKTKLAVLVAALTAGTVLFNFVSEHLH